MLPSELEYFRIIDFMVIHDSVSFLSSFQNCFTTIKNYVNAIQTHVKIKEVHIFTIVH